MPTVVCPSCAAKLNAPSELEGQKVRCKNCGKSFVLRFAADSTSGPVGGSTIDLAGDAPALTKPLRPPKPTSVKVSITFDSWRAAVYQQVADEKFGRNFSAFARAALDTLAEQLGYSVKSDTPKKPLD